MCCSVCQLLSAMTSVHELRVASLCVWSSVYGVLSVYVPISASQGCSNLPAQVCTTWLLKPQAAASSSSRFFRLHLRLMECSGSTGRPPILAAAATLETVSALSPVSSEPYTCQDISSHPCASTHYDTLWMCGQVYACCCITIQPQQCVLHALSPTPCRASVSNQSFPHLLSCDSNSGEHSRPVAH